MTRKRSSLSPMESSAPKNASGAAESSASTPGQTDFTDLIYRLTAYIKEQMDNCPLWVEEARNALIELSEQRDDALMAASRFARELADCRAALAQAKRDRDKLAREEQGDLPL